MTEKEKLESLIREGFKPYMIIRKVSNAEKNKLPEPFFDKDVYALPFSHKDGRRQMFYFVENETLGYAKSLVEEQKKIIGYHLCIYCTVVNVEVSYGEIIHFDKVIGSLKKYKGWDARQSKYNNVFEIHFELEGDDKKIIDSYLKEISQVLLLLSIKNKKGFVAKHQSLMPKFKGQPQSITIWRLEESMAIELSEDDFSKIENIYQNEDVVNVLNTLKSIYTQITNSSKKIVGWASIENVFESKPKNVLSGEERKKILEKISELDFLNQDTEKFNKIKSVLNDSNFMAEKNRNKRIAENISKLTGLPSEDAYKKVKSIAGRRGVSAHTTEDIEEKVDEDICFIEDILSTYIRKYAEIEFF